MPYPPLEEIQQRALGTLWDLRAGRGAIAESLRPYRIGRIENLLEVMKALTDDPERPESERADARMAMEEIETQLMRAVAKTE